MEGNQQKMRESLVDVYNILEKIQSDALHINDISLRRAFNGKVCYAKRIIDTALAAPARNCDVGTAEEQAERFHAFCDWHSSGIGGMCDGNCPCFGGVDGCHCLCKWAQMPYEAEEGGAK